MLLEKLLFGKHLAKGEKILFAVHRHWVMLSKPVTGIGFFGFVIPWILFAIGFNTQVFFWGAVAWSVIAYIMFVYEWMVWYGDAILLTTAGLIKVSWNGPFSNLSARVVYGDIESASYEIKGFWQTVLRYGDFKVNLLGGSQLTIVKANRPKRAEARILELQEKFLNEKGLQDAAGLKDLLSQIAAHQMRQK